MALQEVTGDGTASSGEHSEMVSMGNPAAEKCSFLAGRTKSVFSWPRTAVIKILVFLCLAGMMRVLRLGCERNKCFLVLKLRLPPGAPFQSFQTSQRPSSSYETQSQKKGKVAKSGSPPATAPVATRATLVHGFGRCASSSPGGSSFVRYLVATVRRKRTGHGGRRVEFDR